MTGGRGGGPQVYAVRPTDAPAADAGRDPGADAKRQWRRLVFARVNAPNTTGPRSVQDAQSGGVPVPCAAIGTPAH